MKKHLVLLVCASLGFWIVATSCNSKKEAEFSNPTTKTGALKYIVVSIDSIAIVDFYEKYPELKSYQEDLQKLYAKHQFKSIWHDKQGIVEFGNTLFAKYESLEDEGVKAQFPYEKDLETIFNSDSDTNLSVENAELMLSNLYLFYADKVYKGIPEKVTKQMGWLLPRKEIAFTSLLDSILLNPKKGVQDDALLFSQYAKLRVFLKKYRDIETKGGWDSIAVPADFKSFKPGDSAQAIRQIRNHLFLTDDLKSDSKSVVYDADMQIGVTQYFGRNGFKDGTKILPKHIDEMNVPIGERIKQIMVNMERCRWIDPKLEKAPEYIVVNIPSYNLYFKRDGKTVLSSAVVVGKEMNKTVIFSGKMSYIVFSPYWNVPTSIINKEIKPGIVKNPNYLSQHNMEWNNGQVRQKPGEKNSLGLVKFMFPNSNNIYLHDTPSKGLFANEVRAYSHGCIRVAKPRELAIKILENDKAWTPEKIDEAMHRGKENIYVLKNKIPVYIGYFTAWVRDDGQIYFFKDVYERDQRLAELIYE
ncbi:MAG: L,D-transpeptidase family protein [Flavobacterium sp.]|nr:L,D-transpeptidase family protein [Flavobacterium sp.]